MTGVGPEAGVKRPVLTKWCWLKTARLPRTMVRGSRVYQETDFSFAAQVAARLAGQVAERGLPPGTLPNVNVPAVPPEEIAGVMVTRMGLRIYYDELVRRLDPKGRPYYWIGGQEPGGVLEEGTDLWAVANNYVSVTPLQLDLTDHTLIEQVKGWGLQI